MSVIIMFCDNGTIDNLSLINDDTTVIARHIAHTKRSDNCENENRAKVKVKVKVKESERKERKTNKQLTDDDEAMSQVQQH